MPVYELNLVHLARHHELDSIEYDLDKVTSTYTMRCVRFDGSAFVFHVSTDGLRSHRLSIMEFIQLHLDELREPTGLSIDQKLRKPTEDSYQAQATTAMQLKQQLANLLAEHSLDIILNVPKESLAEYVLQVLKAFHAASRTATKTTSKSIKING